MKGFNLLKNNETAVLFRGPQSIAHRDDVERLSFEPGAVAKGRHRGTDAETPFPCLTCDVCNRNRRVDAATNSVFSNESYSQDKLSAIKQALLREDPLLETDAVAYLQDIHSGVLARKEKAARNERGDTSAHPTTVEENYDFGDPNACVLTPDRFQNFFNDSGRVALYASHEEECNIFFLTEAFNCRGLVIAASLTEIHTTFWNNQPGPVFRCELLANTSCDDLDDWDLAFQTAHDFSDFQPMSKEPLWVLPYDETTGVLQATFHQAQFDYYTAGKSVELNETDTPGKNVAVTETDTEKPDTCCVKGCVRTLSGRPK